MRKYNTVADYKPSPGEENDGELIVEVGTYVTPKTQIEAFILSGRQLENFRQDRYDFDGEIDEDFEDPTRSKGFDMAEGSMILNAIKASENEVKASEKAVETEPKAETKPDAGEKVVEQKP